MNRREDGPAWGDDEVGEITDCDPPEYSEIDQQAAEVEDLQIRRTLLRIGDEHADRRRSPRIDEFDAGHVGILLAHGMIEFRQGTIELSDDGARIATPWPPPIGACQYCLANPPAWGQVCPADIAHELPAGDRRLVALLGWTSQAAHELLDDHRKLRTVRARTDRLIPPGVVAWMRHPSAPVDDIEFEVPTCRVCGCTDEAACPSGCCWVPDPEGGDLCSACAVDDGGQLRDDDGEPVSIVVFDFGGVPDGGAS